MRVLVIGGNKFIGDLLDPESYFGILQTWKPHVVIQSTLVSLAAEYASRLTWVRIFQPHGRHHNSIRLVPKTLSAIQNSQSIHLKYPDSILNWISTRDIASAIELVMSKESPPLKSGWSPAHSLISGLSWTIAK